MIFYLFIVNLNSHNYVIDIVKLIEIERIELFVIHQDISKSKHKTRHETLVNTHRFIFKLNNRTIISVSLPKCTTPIKLVQNSIHS